MTSTLTYTRILILLSLALIALGPEGAAAETEASQESATALLSAPLQPDQADVWYLLHTGYAVKTQSKLFIFDYVRKRSRTDVEPPVRSLSTGWVNPEEIKDLDVYVFVSHPHRDHFDSTIYGWQDTVTNITYFFGWAEAEGPRFHNLVGPRATYTDSAIEVYTINSHHSGVPEVAYLVKTDDLVMYHGGDYNADYKADIAYLGGFVNGVDIAMLNDWCGDPIMEVIVKLKAQLVLPGHFGNKELEPRKLPPCCKELGLAATVGCPTTRGHLFRYTRGS